MSRRYWKVIFFLAGMVLTILVLACLVNSATEGKPQEKLIAITIDDGPKPYVYYGFKVNTQEPSGISGLLNILDGHHVKVTFFYMGWKLAENTSSKDKFIEAARDAYARGHEIENHTNSHGPMLKMLERYGEAWVFRDIDLGAENIKKVTGKRPFYLRPPEWSINADLKQKIEARGYKVVTKLMRGIEVSPLLADINTSDYEFHKHDGQPGKCAPCMLAENTKRIVERRERNGWHSHLMVFHELAITAEALKELIPWLKNKGYRFVRLDEFMKILEKEVAR